MALESSAKESRKNAAVLATTETSLPWGGKLERTGELMAWVLASLSTRWNSMQIFGPPPFFKSSPGQQTVINT
jgi:hypothetical protein